ncbi:MAG: PKD domain-containing protein, partial [Bacteroidetes bacterium]|nr:PKD domain-containing protein [Bacteroidota bacterium]
MKEIYKFSTIYFTQVLFDFKNKLLLQVFLLIFYSYSVFGQLTRTQIINNGAAYTSYVWTATATNIKYNMNCTPVGNINTPSWIILGSNVAIPYCWGGFSSLTSFSAGINAGKCAGDTDTRTYGDCCESCAVGVDCSGFVSRAWGLTSKQSTTTLPNISTAINLTSVQPGDIVNLAGSHVRLVETNYGNGNYRFIESSATDWKVAYHTYTAAALSSYIPRYWNNVIGGCELVCGASANNDNCTGAQAPQALTVGSSCNYIAGTTCGATQSIAPGSCGSINNIALDVWYSFIATASNATVKVQSGSNFDAVVGIYNTACGAPIFTCANATSANGLEMINATGLTIGTTYYIRVYDRKSNQNSALSGGTTFQICVYTNASAPIANFTPLNSSINVGNKINFADGSSNMPTSWLWTFGGAAPNSTLQNPSVTFNTTGTYNISLTATNANGNSVKNGSVNVTTAPVNPVADFIPIGTIINQGTTVSFTDQSTGTPTAWSWNFGGGANNSTTKNPIVTFNTPGTYVISLTVSNAAGSNTKIGSITVNAASTSVNVNISSNNNFPNNLNPVVIFSGSVTGGTSPYSYLWNFGDGGTSALQSPSHTYSSDGTFNVILNVADFYGITASNSYPIVNSIATAGVTADFTFNGSSANPISIALGGSVNFSSALSAGPVSSVLWNFGDGTTSTVANPSKIYSKTGVFTVQLYVYDVYKNSDVEIKYNVINVSGQAIENKWVTLGGQSSGIIGPNDRNCDPATLSVSNEYIMHNGGIQNEFTNGGFDDYNSCGNYTNTNFCPFGDNTHANCVAPSWKASQGTPS